jgi:hypothetical protein
MLGLFNFYTGIDNVFDWPQPLGLLGLEGGNPYDLIGRSFYAGTTIDFQDRATGSKLSGTAVGWPFSLLQGDRALGVALVH